MSGRRRSRLPGPLFAWAGGSRWRQALAWVLRSVVIVVAGLAAYLTIMFVVLPFVLAALRASP